MSGQELTAFSEAKAPFLGPTLTTSTQASPPAILLTILAESQNTRQPVPAGRSGRGDRCNTAARETLHEAFSIDVVVVEVRARDDLRKAIGGNVGVVEKSSRRNRAREAVRRSVVSSVNPGVGITGLDGGTWKERLWNGKDGLGGRERHKAGEHEGSELHIFWQLWWWVGIFGFDEAA
jgi:hypothetical protein